MKKMILIAAIVALFAACSKEDNNQQVNPVPTEGIPVPLMFGTSDKTRAFFDNTATAEPWEKEVKSLQVLVYDNEGAILMRKVFSAHEVTDLKGIVYLPTSAVGTTVKVYAMANVQPSYLAPQTEDKLLSQLLDEGQFVCYNNLFPIVTSGCYRAGGFVMTGSSEVEISNDGVMAQSTIELKRIVAKVAIEIKLAEDFIATHGGGSMRISSGGLKNLRRWSYLFPDYGPHKHDNRYAISQQGANFYGTTFQYLLYIYEQGPEENIEDRPVLYLWGWFDSDNDRNTEGDTIYQTYEIPLEGSGKGEFVRNGYYRIKGTIVDFDHLKLDTSFSVDDWETPSTDDVGDIS